MIDWKTITHACGAIVAAGGLCGGALTVFGADQPPWAAESRVERTEKVLTGKFWKISQNQQEMTRQIQNLTLGQSQSSLLYWQDQFNTLSSIKSKAKDYSTRQELQKQIDFSAMQIDLYKRELQAAAKAARK